MPSTADVLWMSVVRGMRRVSGVCEMCMCLARGVVGGEWVERIGFGLYQTWGVLAVCLCLGCGGVGGEWVRAWTKV